jgi:hypothetical protein
MLGLGIFVNILNSIMGSVVAYLGFKAYKNGAGKLALAIAIAFTIFVISHLFYIIIDIFGLANIIASFTSAVSWVAVILVFRVIGYLVLAYALFKKLSEDLE